MLFAFSLLTPFISIKTEENLNIFFRIIQSFSLVYTQPVFKGPQLVLVGVKTSYGKTVQTTE